MSKNYLFIIGSAIAFFLLLLWLFFTLYFMPYPKVVSITPVDKSKNVALTDKITFYSDREAKTAVSSVQLENTTSGQPTAKEVTLSELSNSRILEGTLTYNKKEAIFLISKKTPLLPSDTYSFKIVLRNRLNNKKTYKITFSTKAIALSSLSQTQQSLILNNCDIFTEGRVKGYEITAYLPHVDTNFFISYDYIQNKNEVLFTVYLEGNQAQAKQDAINWMKSMGANPNNYNITYLEHDF